MLLKPNQPVLPLEQPNDAVSLFKGGCHLITKNGFGAFSLGESERPLDERGVHYFLNAGRSKHPTRSNLRVVGRFGVHGLRLQPVKVWQAWQ